MSDPNGNGNGNGDKPASGINKIRDAIARNQNKGEREEQAAFARTHSARGPGPRRGVHGRAAPRQPARHGGGAGHAPPGAGAAGAGAGGPAAPRAGRPLTVLAAER
jgi:hypothetical protein